MAERAEKRETRRLGKVERMCRVGGSIARCRIGTWREARNAIVGRIVATFQRDPGPLPFALYAIPDFSRVLRSPAINRAAGRRGYGWKGGWKQEITGQIMAKEGIMIDEIAYLVFGGESCFSLFFFVRGRDSFKNLKGFEERELKLRNF